MRGEFLGVWPQLITDVWVPLFDEHDIESDVYCEMYRELEPALHVTYLPEQLADIIDDPSQAKDTFNLTVDTDIKSERELVAFLESIHDVFDDFGGDDLANGYFNRLEAFLTQYSLRYDLRRPCILCPTIPGVFANLVRDLRSITSADAHLDSLMKDYENAVRDLRHDSSEGRIKTCIQKQFNLLEAIGRAFPGVTGNTLGAICQQLNTWPHDKMKDAVRALYGFGNDFPGIRHGGTAANAHRNLDLRDLVAASVLLFGCTPYLEHRLTPTDVFGGATSVAGPIPPAPPVIAPPTIDPMWKRAWKSVAGLFSRRTA